MGVRDVCWQHVNGKAAVMSMSYDTYYKTSEPDEYDAALDDDALFGEFDLSSVP